MGKMLDNEKFKHVDYHHTNLQRTFARVRAQMKAEQKRVLVEPLVTDVVERYTPTLRRVK
jgi:hypothetical protein